MCRLLEIPETDTPSAQITATFAILEGDWEKQMKADLDRIEAGLYERLDATGRQELGIQKGKNKPLIARYVAEQLIARNMMPAFVIDITRQLKRKFGLELPAGDALSELDEVLPRIRGEPPELDPLDEEIPF